MADHLLLENRIQHALHGSLHILDRLIDHPIQPQIHLFPLRNRLCRHIRPYVKPYDNGVRSGCQCHVRLVDRSYTAMDHLDHHFFVGKLQQALLHSLHGSLHVCFHNDWQFLYITGLNLTEQIIQRQAGLGVLKQLVLTLGNECLCIASGFFLVLCRHQHVSGPRHII